MFSAFLVFPFRSETETRYWLAQTRYVSNCFIKNMFPLIRLKRFKCLVHVSSPKTWFRSKFPTYPLAESF